MNNTSNVTNIHNGHEAVDLGLPSGLLWATCNVGATSPEQAGQYFAWGETTGFTIEQFKAGERGFYDLFYKAKSITTDLTLAQDAAHINMGGNWRMPTDTEIKELLKYCNKELTNNYNRTGVAGMLLASKANGNTLFVPASGFCGGTVPKAGIFYIGECGYFRSSNLYSFTEAWHLYFCLKWHSFANKNIGVSYGLREYGVPVRGVCER